MQESELLRRIEELEEESRSLALDNEYLHMQVNGLEEEIGAAEVENKELKEELAYFRLLGLSAS